MGVIHLAEARGPGGFEKLVVVKELKREYADDPVYTRMFLDEARLAARLSHRHIVQTNEVGCEKGRYFMALELLEGGSLHQVRQKLGCGALPARLGLRVLSAVLEALEHAHALTDDDGYALGIVHRDVSPQNIFLTFDGDVKLIDFGVAKSADRTGQATTRVGVVKGSIPYMAPDHVDGSSIDRRADVFAVGVILREMILGERLWGDVDDLTMLRRLIARDLPAFPDDGRVPVGLRAIVERAMATRRSERYESAAAMRDAIEGYLLETDPRGSLAELGPWLGRVLKDERGAFRALVRDARSRTSGREREKRADAKQGRVKREQVWLPSSELMTRVSFAPALASLPAPRRSGTVRNAFVGLMVVSGLVLGAIGVALPVRPMTNAAVAPRAPRVAEDIAPPTLVTTTAAVTAITEATEPVARDVAAAGEAIAADSTTTAASVPARVRTEALPANPYEPED